VFTKIELLPSGVRELVHGDANLRLVSLNRVKEFVALVRILAIIHSGILLKDGTL